MSRKISRRDFLKGSAATAATLMTMSFVPGIALAEESSEGVIGTSTYPQTTTVVTQSEVDHAQVSLKIAKEGIVLLENNNDVLPIAAEGDIALFGIGAIQTTKGGTGSGSVNNRIVYEDGTVVEGEAIGLSVLDGFVNAGYNVLTQDYLVALDEANPNETSGLGMGSSNLADDTALTELFSDEELAEMAAATDTAFYTIRRNAGEGADRGVDADYNLSDNELANIATLVATFDKVVVLLNVINCDASWFAESGADGLVLVSNPGELGGDAIVSVLNGETNPSGKLVDTWASSIYDWPSTEYFSNINEDDPWADKVEFYSEGVFVGYRYFDTYKADAVLHEFGYGLSYTTFDIVVDDVTADAENVNVTVTVTNTGDVAGKEVVQVYFSAPEGTLAKPYQELGAYGKTDELEAGASQTMTISYHTTEMSSYSEEQAAYIMEAGDYVIRVGNSSRNTVNAAVITLDETAVTEQLKNILEITSDGVYPGGSSGQYDDLTLEDNLASYDELVAAFEETAAAGTGLDGGSTDGAIAISLSAADIVTKNPYEEKGVDDSGAVKAYISATTEAEYAGTVGYDFAQNQEYEIIPVYYDADGNEASEEPAEMKNFRVKSGSEEDGTAEYYTLLDVANGELTLEQFISGMTISEMADICEGGSKSPDSNGQSSGGASPNTANAGQDVVDYINGVYVDGQAGQTCGLYAASRMIPSMTNADGPAGLRISQSYTGLDGVEYYQYCTAYPVGTMIAQTWNQDLAYEMGVNVGEEMVNYGISQWLAPGMNIHRNPLCGRNFEYYSEDPLVSGLTGGLEALGVQSNAGVGVTFKHFAGNEQENSRGSQNDVVSERAFREIFTKQFETAVKTSKPMGMMTTYGIVNGVPTANSYDLLENLLRTEWGFEGLVMTDWGGSGGMTDSQAMHSGNDLIMPGNDVSGNLLAYIYDVAPVITVDESGIATEGGFPSTTATTTTWGTWVWNSVSTDWGDYTLSAEGSPYEVVAYSDAFETTEIATLPEDADDFVYVTVKDYVDSLAEEGTASYVDNGDGTVTITYLLKQVSVEDGTKYAAKYADHAVTKTTSILGEERYNTMSLADLQKATLNILRVLMRTTQFEDLTGSAVGSYTEAVGDTTTYVTVTK
ncbi:MAG: glycoside hydrolase family 3 C-terminal domain-containing protein [Lachnospiraceae bacterium]|nr:glycoside hydrolase family 3 C-terminal domain-containing protein [Lachnospiraceae bacterium]